jgi:hypothetical protein
MKHNVTMLIMVCALGLSSGIQADQVTDGDDLLLMNDALSEEALSGQRGEGTVMIDDISITEADLDAISIGNSVRDSVTGGNYISGSAFNGANGMFDTIQNSGNNVLIQKATIVNINIE